MKHLFIVKIIFLTILLVVSILFLSKSKRQKYSIEHKSIVKEWIGKEIKFPECFQCNISGRDTSYMLCANMIQTEFKILLYVDSTGCTNCKLQLMEWNDLIKQVNSIQRNKLSFLFFISPKDVNELKFILQMNDFQYPVFIDIIDEVNKLNNFSKLPAYQCFLLDKHNKVLSVGNPVRNSKILELYMKLIKGSNAEE